MPTLVREVGGKGGNVVKRNFRMYLFGILLAFSPIRALMALQTSINIKDGVG